MLIVTLRLCRERCEVSADANQINSCRPGDCDKNRCSPSGLESFTAAPRVIRRSFGDRQRPAITRAGREHARERSRYVHVRLPSAVSFHPEQRLFGRFLRRWTNSLDSSRRGLQLDGERISKCGLKKQQITAYTCSLRFLMCINCVYLVMPTMHINSG